MATSTRALQDQAISLQSRIKTLINSDLKEICRGENLPVSGVKAALQNRIIQRAPCSLLPHGKNEADLPCVPVIETFVKTGDVQGLARIRHRIANHGAAPSAGPYPVPGPAFPSTSPTAPGPYDMPNGFPRPPTQAIPARNMYPSTYTEYWALRIQY